MLADVPEGAWPEDPPGVSRYFVTPSTTVPMVVGMQQKAASEAVYEAHLRPNFVEVNSLEAKGTVLTQDPAEGATAAHGQTVTMEVSSGLPPQAPLPDLRNLTVDQAVAALAVFEEETEVGLEFSVTFTDTADPAQVGKVITTNPAPGATVTHGGTLVILVGKLAPGGGPPGPGG